MIILYWVIEVEWKKFAYPALTRAKIGSCFNIQVNSIGHQAFIKSTELSVNT